MLRMFFRSRSSALLQVAVMACCVVACGLPAKAVVSIPHRAKSHDLKQQVEDLEEKWRTAQLSMDVAAMDTLLSDDYIGISLNGQVNTKVQQLERLRSQRFSLTKLELSDRKVKMIGAIAIVTSLAEVEGISDSQPIKGTYRYTRVYQRVASGTWKITSFEATRIPQPHMQQAGTPPQAKPTVTSPGLGPEHFVAN